MSWAEDRYSYVLHLARRFSEIGTMLAEHAAYYEETLPHIFFGELTAWVQAQQEVSPLLRGLLDDLDHALQAGSEDVQELVAVSFLENLPQTAWVRDLLSPDPPPWS